MTKKSSPASGEVAAPADPFDLAVESFENDQQQAAAARIPPEHGGIQINFCKNPTCDNFGQPEVGGVAKRAEIEAAFGVGEMKLDWQRLDNKRACRIRVDIPAAGYRDEDRYAEAYAGMVDAMVRLERALKPYVQRLAGEPS